MYNFNLLSALISLVPTRLRQVKLLAWISVLAKLVDNMKAAFLLWRTDKIYQLKHNSQLASLEHILNDTFDDASRLIYITDAFSEQQVYAYNRREPVDHLIVYNKAELEEDPYIYNRSAFTSTVDFIVWVPDTITFDMNRMRSIIDTYKLAGKEYEIRTFSTQYFVAWDPDQVICTLSGRDWEVRWYWQQCVLTEFEWIINWRNLVPVRIEDLDYKVQWLQQVCVKENQYEIGWDGRICTQAEAVESWDVEWTEASRACKLIEMRYQVYWDFYVCVKEEGGGLPL